MPKIFAITKFAVRRDDGTVKELPYGCYAYEFYSKCNYTIEKLESLLFNYTKIIKVIDERYVIAENNEKYDILDLAKMRVIHSALTDMKEVIKKLEGYDKP